MSDADFFGNPEGQRVIFNPTKKILANLDRVIEFFRCGTVSPILVEIDPSNICNQGCSFCLSSHIHFKKYKGEETYSTSVLSKEHLMSLCTDLVDANVRAINWTGGGEPTVNPHLKEAIQYIGDNSDIKMGIFTNGTLILKYDLADVLLRNLTWIRISIDAGTEDTYNSVRNSRRGGKWSDMLAGLELLLGRRKELGSYCDIGVGFVITPDNYKEIVSFAQVFSLYDVDYCQYKPEIITVESEEELQRSKKFWEMVQRELDVAKEVLGEKFQVNEYKIKDLIEDRESHGRNYAKCFGSQIQPCIGADGEVYVCTNHRGHKKYSYGNISDRPFHQVWEDVANKKRVMETILRNVLIFVSRMRAIRQCGISALL